MKSDFKTFYLIKKTIRKKGWMNLPADGTSMFPLIQKGNICRFVFCESTELKKGDIALFQTSSGQLVAHRFLTAVTKNKQVSYVFKGDTNLGADEPVSGDQIIGKLVSIQKGKKAIHTAGFLFLFWRRIILAFPPVSSFLRTYLNKKAAQK